MANDISIVMKLQTDIDAKLKTITSTSQGCSKAMEELSRKGQQLGDRYRDLTKRSAEASSKALEVKRAMDDAAKAFKKSGDEADRLTFERLREEYNDLTTSAKGYADEAKNTVKEIRALSDEVRKMDSAGGGPNVSGGLSAGVSDGSIIQKIGTAGLFKMAGDALSQSAGAALESAIGKPMADLASGIAAGAASGAAIGSIVPGLGTALGAAAGAGIGVINGATQIFTERDDAFKDYYRGLYEDTNAATAERLSSGSTLAAGRETTKLSFNTLLGGEEQSSAFLKDVLNTANTTPFLYDDLVGISKTMLSFGTAVDDIIPTLTKVGDAGAALGLSTGDIGTVATYLGRMQSSDKATLEYLNPLNERGFSVFQWLADDQGVSVGDVYSQISKGELSGSYVSDVILTQFEKLYAGMMEIQSKSTEGLDSTLQGLKENVDAAGGDAYNEARKESKEADIAAYGGVLGDKLAELSAIGGQVQAHGENLKEQYQREALEAVLTGTMDKASTVFSEEDAEKLEALRAQFAAAEETYRKGGEDSLEAGQKMVDLREEAEALATAAYESSEWAQKQVDMDLQQIDATRELTAAMVSATDAWRQANAFSKGGMSIPSFFGAGRIEEEQQERGDKGLSSVYKVWEAPGLSKASENGSPSSLFKTWDAPGYAVGLDYVPYDEFPALLHQGERVLTAAEARTMDRGGNGAVSVTISGNEFHVREDSDVDAVAETLAQKIRAAMLRGGG